MAAEERGEFLHLSIAFRALEILRNSPSGVWKFEAATRMSNALKFVVVILESYVETLIGGLLPPWIETPEGGQDGGAVAVEDHSWSFAQNRPSSFFVVAEELFDFLHQRIAIVRFS